MPKLKLSSMCCHYERAGAGEPLLLLPGALGTGRADFDHQIDFFGRHYDVIAPDPRGYGQSRPPARTYPVNFYELDADDMFELMSSLGHSRFSVMGWSDGANVATLMAVRRSESVERLVVWGGNSFLTEEECHAFRAIRAITSWSPRAAEALRLIYGDELDSLWDSYVTGLEKLYNAGGEIYKSRLDQVHCPTLILHGDRDPLVPIVHPVTIHRGIAGSKLFIFPEGKHNIHVKYAEEFNRNVLAFLNECPSEAN
jgi:valacyclovir hydrolase